MKPAELHALYCELTGLRVRESYMTSYSWAEFLKMEFTPDDLRLVIAFTRRKISRGEGGYNPQSLLLRVLSADCWTKFDERLQLARQERGRGRGVAARGDARPPGNSALRTPQSAPPITDSQRLAAKAGIEKFKRELRGEQGA
jgi:hypothetical protein